MKKNNKILLVEDNLVLGRVVREYLQMHDFDVYYCADAEEALDQFMKKKFCISILGDKDGIAVAQKIRKKNSDIPIILLSSKNLSEDIKRGFEIGADNYMIKPFNLDELLLRIRVFLKRSSLDEGSLQFQYRIGNLTFDSAKKILIDDKKIYNLTGKETEIMCYLCQNIDQVVKREDILMNIWGQNDFFMGKSLDVFIARIRKHLKAQSEVRLETIHSVGFRLRKTRSSS